MEKFENVTRSESLAVNGGGLAGAAIGYIIGVCVGGIAAACVYRDPDTKGDPNQGKAAITAFTSAVVTCTTIGAVSTGIF